MCIIELGFDKYDYFKDEEDRRLIEQMPELERIGELEKRKE